MSDLPQSWELVPICDVGEVQGGIQKQPKRRPVKNTAPFLRVANILRGKLDLSEVHEVEIFDGELDNFALRTGDLLVVEGNGSPDQIGRAAMWRDQIPGCCHQNHLIRVRPSSVIIPEFLELAWNSPAITAQLQNVASSTSGLYTLSTSKIKQIKIPVPPLPEQRRIVAALEDHLSRLDAADASVNRVELRSQLLASRVRDAGAERLNASIRPLASLLSEPLANGRSVPTDKQGFPVLRLTAIQNGRLELAERKGGRWSETEATPFRVQKGDFFVSRGNGSLRLVGRGALLEEEPDPVAFPDTMIRIRLDRQRMLPDFLRMMWDSKQVRSQIQSAARTTAGIYKINQKIIENILVPVPRIAEQEQVASELEQTLASAARATSLTRQAQLRAVKLRRSLMAEAFAGRLLLQDSREEPATVLLERIRAERSTQPRARRTRKIGPRQETLL